VNSALKLLEIPYELIIVVRKCWIKLHTKSMKLKMFAPIPILKPWERYAVEKVCYRAKGDIIGFIDAGMAIDTKAIALLLPE